MKNGSAEPGPAGLVCMMSPGKYLLTPTRSAWETLTLKQLTQLSANSQRPLMGHDGNLFTLTGPQFPLLTMRDPPPLLGRWVEMS